VRKLSSAVVFAVHGKNLGVWLRVAIMKFLTRNLQLADYGWYALAVVIVNGIVESIGLVLGSTPGDNCSPTGRSGQGGTCHFCFCRR
jgi:hypothetical protein